MDNETASKGPEEVKAEKTEGEVGFWSKTSTKVGVLILTHAACIAGGFYYGKYMSGDEVSGAAVSMDEL